MMTPGISGSLPKAKVLGPSVGLLLLDERRRTVILRADRASGKTEPVKAEDMATQMAIRKNRGMIRGL